VNLPGKADVAFAPRLSPIISTSQKPTYGTLIFHPSLLPRHQGPDAVKWAFLYGEKVTGACWFWFDEDRGYSGDVCEMEILAIRDEEYPHEFYDRAVIPAAMKMLYYIIQDLSNGIIRRRIQNQDAVSIDPPLSRLEDEY
jgi:formyltetrahydrofolate dehydrogenase